MFAFFKTNNAIKIRQNTKK